jgi:hypothetical protein
MEVHSTVSIECSKETFRERGGVEGMSETFVLKQLDNLAKTESVKRLLRGDLERAAAAIDVGLMFKAAMRSGFSQMRIAKVRPPRISAR